MTYHLIFNKSNTTGPTSGAGTIYSSGGPDFISLSFCWTLVAQALVFCIVFFSLFVCTFSIGHYIVRRSSAYGF